jgi:hypothetical protein
LDKNEENEEYGSLKKLPVHSHNDKKENHIFLIYKEIKSGAVAKYMTNGLLHIWENFCAFPHILGSPSSYMTLQLFRFKFPIRGKFDFLLYQRRIELKTLMVQYSRQLLH